MPSAADKQDQDYDRRQARERRYGQSWGDQKAYDNKMKETKEVHDAAREVHEAKQKKQQDDSVAELEASHERQEKVTNLRLFVAGKQ